MRKGRKERAVHPYAAAGHVRQAHANALRAAFNDEHIYAPVPASAALGHFDMLLFARTSADVESMRRRAEQIDGVIHAEAWLFRAIQTFHAWLDDAIAHDPPRHVQEQALMTSMITPSR